MDVVTVDVVVKTSQGEAELSVHVREASTPLGRLLEGVTGVTAPRVCFIDGRPVLATSPIGRLELLDGSVISTAADDPVNPGQVELAQIAGRGAGTRIPLPEGTFLLGPGQRVNAPELDAGAVSEARVRLVVDSDSSVHATALSGPARLDGVDLGDSASGGRAWHAETLDTSGRAFRLVRDDTAGGEPAPSEALLADTADARSAALAGAPGRGSPRSTITFNRPPRPAPEAPGPAITLPTSASTGSSKRVDRSTGERFRRAVSARWTADRDRLRSAHPDLVDAMQMARRRDPSLWQRRPGDPDAFSLALGLADLPWAAPLERTSTSPSDPALRPQEWLEEWAGSIIDPLGPLPMVPVVVDLKRERGIGLVGPAASGRSLARGLMIEAAVTHGPADLDAVVLTTEERAPSWEWVKWLPHVRATGTNGVITSRAEFGRWSALVLPHAVEPAQRTSPSHITLVVIDGPAWWRERDAPLRALFADDALPLRYIALAGTRADVPAPCTTVVTSRPDHSVSVDHVVERQRIGAVLPFLATASQALETARRLAPLDDPDVVSVAVPSRSSPVSTVELLELGDFDATTFVRRWSAARTGASMIVGRSDHATVSVDLASDGPNLLVVDGRERGESPLVNAIVAGLAAEHRPDDLHMVLVAGGGSSISEVWAGLPHVVGVVTDVDESRAERLMRCLRNELQRRNDPHDVDQPDSSTHSIRPSRLVVIVDDCAALAAALPRFLPSLADLAKESSVGLHVVIVARTLPTTYGEVSDLIDVADLRIASAVPDEAARALMGPSSVAHVDVDQPGGSSLQRRDREPIGFQAASTVAVPPPPQGVDVRPFVLARDLTAIERRLERSRTAALVSADDATIARLVAAMTEAAVNLGVDRQRRVILDPLPDAIAMRMFFDEHPGDAVPYALVDDLDEPRQSPAWWDPARGNLLAVGPGDTARVLVTLALGMAERHAADDVHLYVLDSEPGRLARLQDLPHCGGLCVAADDRAMADLARFIGREIDRRTALASELGGPQQVAAAEPTVVVMIADVGALDGRGGGHDEMLGVLDRLGGTGHALGLCTVLAAQHIGAVPEQLVDDRVVIQLAESAVDVHGSAPQGRALRMDDGVTMQLVAPPDDLRAAVRSLGLEPATQRPPRSFRGGASPVPGSIEGAP